MQERLKEEREEATDDEMVGQYYRFNVHELGQIPGDGEGQGSLECFSLWGHKESDMTGQLKKNERVDLKSSHYKEKNCTC